MRVVMLGTGTYAVPLLEGLYTSSHEVPAVVTRPERKKNKRGSLPPSPMRERADLEGTPVFAPDDINAESSHTLLKDLQPDLFMVCDYGQILSPATLSLAPRGGLNLHASLLPKYRGAAPIHWAIYHGESQTGNTVIQMNAGVDAGPIVAQQTTRIEASETTVQLEKRLAKLGSDLIVATIDQLARGELQPATQAVEKMTRAPKLQKEDGQINWNRSAEAIHNQIRAMVPWPKSFTYYLSGVGPPLRLIIEGTSVFLMEAASQSYVLATMKNPGTVLLADRDCLFVQTGDGVLQIDQLQPAGKKVMSASAFLRGYRVQSGDQLGPLPDPSSEPQPNKR